MASTTRHVDLSSNERIANLLKLRDQLLSKDLKSRFSCLYYYVPDEVYCSFDCVRYKREHPRLFDYASRLLEQEVNKVKEDAFIAVLRTFFCQQHDLMKKEQATYREHFKALWRGPSAEAQEEAQEKARADVWDALRNSGRNIYLPLTPQRSRPQTPHVNSAPHILPSERLASEREASASPPIAELDSPIRPQTVQATSRLSNKAGPRLAPVSRIKLGLNPERNLRNAENFPLAPKRSLAPFTSHLQAHSSIPNATQASKTSAQLPQAQTFGIFHFDIPAVTKDTQTRKKDDSAYLGANSFWVRAAIDIDKAKHRSEPEQTCDKPKVATIFGMKKWPGNNAEAETIFDRMKRKTKEAAAGNAGPLEDSRNNVEAETTLDRMKRKAKEPTAGNGGPLEDMFEGLKLQHEPRDQQSTDNVPKMSSVESPRPRKQSSFDRSSQVSEHGESQHSEYFDTSSQSSEDEKTVEGSEHSFDTSSQPEGEKTFEGSEHTFDTSSQPSEHGERSRQSEHSPDLGPGRHKSPPPSSKQPSPSSSVPLEQQSKAATLNMPNVYHPATVAATLYKELIRELPKVKGDQKKKGSIYVLRAPKFFANFKPSKGEQWIKIGISDNVKSRMTRFIKECGITDIEECWVSQIAPMPLLRRIETLCKLELMNFNRVLNCRDAEVRRLCRTAAHGEYFALGEDVVLKTVKKWRRFLDYNPYGEDDMLRIEWEARFANDKGWNFQITEGLNNQKGLAKRLYYQNVLHNRLEAWIENGNFEIKSSRMGMDG